MIYALILSTVLLLCGAVFCALYFPFWKRKTPLLPVLCFGKIGTAPKNSALKKEWTSPQQLAKRLDWVLKLGFTPITPEDLLAAKQGVALPPRPIMLVFKYGLQSFYKEVFPLLQAREIKACVCLCAQQIGQYNAWQNPDKEAWQNTLNEENLTELKKSKRVSFAAHGLSYTCLNTLGKEQAIHQAQESKTRLEKLHKLPVNAFFYPAAAPTPELDAAINPLFGVTFSCASGVNRLENPLKTPLKTLPAGRMSLWRLRAKITRG